MRLVIAFGLLQIADLAVTIYGTHHGIREQNPLGVLLLALPLPLLIAIKLGLPTAVAVRLSRSARGLSFITYATIVMALIVAWNLLQVVLG